MHYNGWRVFRGRRSHVKWNAHPSTISLRLFWEGLLLTLIFQRPKCYKNPHYDTQKPCIIAEDFLWISTFLFSVGRTCSNMPLREWIVRLHILFLKLFHHGFLFLNFFFLSLYQTKWKQSPKSNETVLKL